MAKPIKFEQSNSIWRGTEGVGDLETYSQDDGKGPHVSCWRMGWWERTRLLLTGRVWLLCWTGEHPPVLLSAEFPFRKSEGEERHENQRH